MLENGLIITITGMSVVFMFLTLLVFCMMLMSKVMILVNKFMPEVVETPVAARTCATTDDDVAVAIAVAKIKMNK